jgi:hypothetical protein
VTDSADKRDGRAVYGMGGLDGLGGRTGGRETTSACWTDQTDGSHNFFCQGEGRGFESRRPLQKVLVSVPFAGGRFAGAAHVPTGLPTAATLGR